MAKRRKPRSAEFKAKVALAAVQERNRWPRPGSSSMKLDSVTPVWNRRLGHCKVATGLERCRDHSELWFERYVALGILGRNLHTLGRLPITRQNADSPAAATKRKSAA